MPLQYATLAGASSAPQSAGEELEAHLRPVVGAVVGALELGDPMPTGEPAGGLDGHHHRLAARVGEPNPLDAGDPLDEEGGQLDLLGRRQRERGAAGQSTGGRFRHRRMGVAVDQRRVVVQQVKAPLAIHVDQPAPLAFRRIDRAAAT